MLPERLLSVGAILAPSHTAIGKGYRVLRSLGRGSLVLVLLLGFALADSHSARAQLTATPPNFKVAFIGDMGINTNAQSVLQLIENEGADMAIHLGDLGYGNESNPQTAIGWDAQVTNVLGASFPYFAVTGNHDVGNWATYQDLLLDRLALVSGASCSGDYGVQAACTYQGLFFILSGIGSQPDLQPDYGPHVSYIQSQLAADNSIWRICAWHKNQKFMQVGGKEDEVGWQAYEACRQYRAIIATAHEHSYHRTRTLTNTQTQTVDTAWPDVSPLRVSPGATFVFVSGLGGNSIRDQERCTPTTFPYGCNGEWASIHTSNQGANYGVLFIEFHVDGDPYKASGYFKEIDGDVKDTFTVYSEVPVGGVAELPRVVGAAHTSGGASAWWMAGVAAVVGATALGGALWGLSRRLRG